MKHKKIKILFFIPLLWAFILSVGVASAEPATEGKMSLEEIFAEMKKYSNLDQYYKSMSVDDPASQFEESRQYWISQGVPLEKIEIKDFLVKKNRLYLPGVEQPFIFTKDLRSVEYREVALNLVPKESAKDFHNRMKKVWGGFPEFNEKKRARSNWRILDSLFFASEAQAVEPLNWLSGRVAAAIRTFYERSERNAQGRIRTADWQELHFSCSLRQGYEGNQIGFRRTPGADVEWDFTKNLLDDIRSMGPSSAQLIERMEDRCKKGNWVTPVPLILRRDQGRRMSPSEIIQELNTRFPPASGTRPTGQGASATR